MGQVVVREVNLRNNRYSIYTSNMRYNKIATYKYRHEGLWSETTYNKIKLQLRYCKSFMVS